IVLATSRQPLGLPGEQELPLAPLPVPVDGSWSGTREAGGIDGPARTDVSDPSTINPQLSALALCASVRLFVDRAQAVKPDFQLTRGNAATVAQLCQRLEGLPLAIELAAARATVLTPSQMLARLSQRFDLLVRRTQPESERHRSLRAAL